MKDGGNRLAAGVDEGGVVLEGMAGSEEPGKGHLLQTHLCLDAAPAVRLHLHQCFFPLHQIPEKVTSTVIWTAAAVSRSEDYQVQDAQVLVGAGPDLYLYSIDPGPASSQE